MDKIFDRPADFRRTDDHQLIVTMRLIVRMFGRPIHSTYLRRYLDFWFGFGFGFDCAHELLVRTTTSTLFAFVADYRTDMSALMEPGIIILVSVDPRSSAICAAPEAPVMAESKAQ